MKKIIQLFSLLFFSIQLSSCNTLIKEEKINDGSYENLNVEKTQIEVRFSCGEDGISNYIEDGWVIVDEYSEEKICTWKSFPATKDCDMGKDKGCKVTKPDEIGIERIYLLER